jgi:hypothetical protein
VLGQHVEGDRCVLAGNSDDHTGVKELVVAEDRREGVRSTERVDHSADGVSKSAREDEERRAEADSRDELRKDDDADPTEPDADQRRKPFGASNQSNLRATAAAVPLQTIASTTTLQSPRSTSRPKGV